MRLMLKYLKNYKKYIVINLVSTIGFLLIELGIPTLLARAINVGFRTNDYQYIIKMAIGMVAFALIGLCGLIIQSYSTNRMASGVIRDMRRDMFDKVQSFSHEEYEKFGISRLITNTGNDPFQIMQFLVMALKTGVTAPIMIVASILMIAVQGGSMALIVVAAVPVLLLGAYLINQKSRPLSLGQQNELDHINLNMRENLTGLRVIRAFNNQDFQEDRFSDINKTYSGLAKKVAQITAIALPGFTVIFTLVLVLVLWFGSVRINSAVLEYGTLAAFIEYVFHVLYSCLMVAVVFTMYPRASVSANRIARVFESDISIKPNLEGVTETKTHGVVEFKNVTFAYSDNAQEPVIRNVSFTARPGETVAFIGSTGSGKSTIIQLIPRMFDVTSGQVLVDGVDVRDYNLEVLRKKIGFIPQKATLFSGTIADNLRFGKEDATLEEMQHAARTAQAEEFIESRPEKYESFLAEGGTNLSGGQKQRLCITRALIRQPDIYIFDDSFSALDYKTDATLRKQLRKETLNSTVIIVAQRVSTIMDADRILVIDQGRVVANGTHRELLANSEIYYEIASSQLSKEELERE